MPFSLKHEPIDKGYLVHPIGSADIESCEEMEAAIGKLVEQKPALLVLDLSKLEHIPSAGLSAFIRINRAMKDSGGKLRVAAVPPPIQKLLTATKLDLLLPMFMTREEACRVESVGG